MRNLRQYPITTAEKAAAVKRALDEIDISELAPGDLQAAALRCVYEELTAAAEAEPPAADLASLPTDGENPQLMAAILDRNLTGEPAGWDWQGASTIKHAWTVVRRYLLSR